MKESKTFWVSDDFINDFNKGHFEYRDLAKSKKDDSDIEMTFTWEAPDKVIMVSEKEFNEAVKHADREYTSRPYKEGCPYRYIDYLKEKLFKGGAK